MCQQTGLRVVTDRRCKVASLSSIVCICFAINLQLAPVQSMLQIAVTAFKPEAKHDFAQRQSEADGLKKAQSKTFLHRKRGWAMRRQVAS